MTEIPQEFLTMVESGIDFVKRTGMKVLELEKGHVVLKMPIDINRSHVGSIYAGALFTLAEIPGGALYLTSFDISKYYPIVKEMTIQFKKPAATDATISVQISEEEVQRISREAEEKGKADYILEAVIKDEKGDVVCKSIGTYQLRKLGT